MIDILGKLGVYSICRGKYKRSQFLFLIEAILTNAAVVITTGVFLSGYIVLLEGSDFLVGILNSSINWAMILALFSYLIYERLKRRKRLLITLYSISRLLASTIIFIPLITNNNAITLTVVSIMVITGNILWGIYSIGFTVWLVSVLPNDIRKQYIYMRMLFLRIFFTLATIIMGFVLDWSKKSYTGFFIVFSFGIILTIINIIILANTHEPANTVNKSDSFNIAIFFEPIKHKKFRGYLIFVFLFYLCMTMSSSFTPLYLIKYMKFDYGFISFINVIMYACMILFTRFWSRIEMKKGIAFVFEVTALFIAAEFIIYSFLQEKTFYLLYFAPIFSGIGNSGFNVAIFTYRYELIPEQNRTIYEGWYGAVFGLGTLCAPFIGSKLLNILPKFSNSLYQYSNFQLLYLISFTLIAGVVIFAFNAPRRIRLIDEGMTKKVEH